MMTAQEIRQSFKKYFESKNHEIVPSASIVVKDDPTLMFTNAGMNQFKDIILGNVPAQYTRVANSQKCLRVNGKHNDMEEVGHDTYHHTMFEMLGNWSFGDYFKKEAIEYAWEYLTEIIKLDKDRLYVTVFDGNETENLERDSEAAEYWRRYIPSTRIIDGSKKNNFWEMGDTGPCGPCSEIYMDVRPNEERARVDALTLINQNHPQIIEVWNLVFMQFNRKSDGLLENLPKKMIDTGMGFERLCMVVQGKTSSYDTDVFQPIIHAIEKLTKLNYNQSIKISIAMRVIADHIRTVAFAIADGQLPSNVKAGYVIRRILRRSIRYAYTFLEQRNPFIYALVPFLIDSMLGVAYPELIVHGKSIEMVIKEEEKSFLKTLEKGIKLLDKKIQKAKKEHQTVIDGADAFILHDTYGFPLDLTELILREQHINLEKTTFYCSMNEQKKRARNVSTIETTDWIILKEGETKFVGYDETSVQTQITRYRKIKQKSMELYQVVLDKTPFFAEMGGQIGDIGELIDYTGNSIEVVNTKKENSLIVHFTKELPKFLDRPFYAKVNKKVRHAVECNHTTTHLLHEALRLILGPHVAQKGSYVSADILRFDFSHFQKVTKKEIREIERRVTDKIRQNLVLEETRQASIQKACQLGAIALFEEKYGKEVRVVKFGSSVELCGGTHLKSTGHIGSFRIICESSIAAGIRRIEAITAEKVEDFFYDQQDILYKLKTILNTPSDVYQSVWKLMKENISLKKQVEEFFKEKILLLKCQVTNNKQLTSSGINLFVLEGIFPFSVVRELAFQIGGEYVKKCFFVAATLSGNTPLLTILISHDLVKNGLNAVRIIREAAKKIQGNGGGQPHFASAGGKDIHGLPKALDQIINMLR